MKDQHKMDPRNMKKEKKKVKMEMIQLTHRTNYFMVIAVTQETQKEAVRVMGLRITERGRRKDTNRSDRKGMSLAVRYLGRNSCQWR